ncbi:hypothetical protein BP6252_10236 [Coleophoma cylindrospora]|uniref:Uncharacterized protein n=1 Tax=Coleophoma cylindrospora TaxID=1849047 RepID=A0A3D8QS07_9HELO|nr:hypothetical protein BP6252_10236 [Coleophoma cylindrospora]
MSFRKGVAINQESLGTSTVDDKNPAHSIQFAMKTRNEGIMSETKNQYDGRDYEKHAGHSNLHGCYNERHVDSALHYGGWPNVRATQIPGADVVLVDQERKPVIVLAFQALLLIPRCQVEVGNGHKKGCARPGRPLLDEPPDIDAGAMLHSQAEANRDGADDREKHGAEDGEEESKQVMAIMLLLRLTWFPTNIAPALSEKAVELIGSSSGGFENHWMREKDGYKDGHHIVHTEHDQQLRVRPTGRAILFWHEPLVQNGSLSSFRHVNYQWEGCALTNDNAPENIST